MPSEVCLFAALSNGEFDPGSGQTLAACVKHASRTVYLRKGVHSGGRLSITWMTCLLVGNSGGKLSVKPHELVVVKCHEEKPLRRLLIEGFAAHQVDGAVKAYHADDGWPV